MGSKRILVIDDSKTALAFCRASLEPSYEVETSDNPLSAAHLMRKFQPDLVLLDVNMPALPGDVAAQILSAHGRTKVLLVLHSDLPVDELRERTERSGAVGWIAKGADGESLARQVAGFLQRKR